jgi:predicted phage terminase large subunit-like protein
MKSQTRDLLDQIVRGSLKRFIHRAFQTVAPAQTFHHNWHIDAMAWHLEQCASGEIKRLLITLPPRNLKSHCASVAFTAWLLGHDPTRRIVCASYSADLASKHARDSRTVMESSWYRRAFPGTILSAEKKAEMDFMTTRQGFRYSTSVGGTLTGRGGNFLIIDDPLKPEDALSEAKRSAVNEWYDRTLYSRLDDKRKGVIILIQQRLHLEDLAGHVTKQEKWVHLDLAAIAESEQTIAIGPHQTHLRKVGDLLHPARESEAELAQTKAVLGSRNFSAQYQQNPLPLDGEAIKWHWFCAYDVVPERQSADEIIQSWDTAYKAKELSDYSVCTTWLACGNRYYLIDVLREKLLYPELRKIVTEHALRHHADVVLIENKGSGISLIDDLRQENKTAMPTPIACDFQGDKLTRMATQAAKIEAGQVLLPRSAPWLDDFRTELLQFPYGRHDDQVDSLSQFLNWMHKRKASFSWDMGWDTYDSRWSGLMPQPPLAPPAPKPNVYVVDRSGYGRRLMPASNYAAQIAEAADKTHAQPLSEELGKKIVRD